MIFNDTQNNICITAHPNRGKKTTIFLCFWNTFQIPVALFTQNKQPKETEKRQASNKSILFTQL
jgi:hypothetical protein